VFRFVFKSATLTLAAAMFCFFPSLVLGQSATEEWAEHPQPGGGILPLPDNFTIIELSSDAVGKPAAGGVTIYSQSLINAKGLHNGVINSIKASRYWRQDATGRILGEHPNKPEFMISALLDGMPSAGITFEVIDGPKPFACAASTGWRVSVRFNNGVSRIDQFAFLEGGILYTLSSAYQIRSADYWSPKTDEIVARWKPSAIAGDLSAPAKTPPSTEWKSVVVGTGERFMLPPTWVVVARDETPEKETAEGMLVAVYRLLNMRPNRAKGDVSTVNVYSVTAEKAGTQQSVPVTDADLLDLHNSMVSGTGLSMNPAKPGGAVRREVAGMPAYFTSLIANRGTGLAADGFLLSTIRGDRAYMFIATYRPGQAAEFERTITDILRRSTFVAAAPKPTPFAASSLDPTTPIDPTDDLFDPMLLLISFLLTWGIGLTPPLLIRYAVLRRPFRDKWPAVVIAGGFLILNIAIFTALGSKSKTHGALMLVCFASYYILRQGKQKVGQVEK